MKLPKSFYNWVSLAGSAIAVVSLFMIFFSIAVSVFLDEGSTYLGLFSYIVLPVFLVIGLLLIPIGMLSKNRKKKKGLPVKDTKWPIFDLNNYRTRNAFMIFSVGTTVFLLLSAIGSYEAFHYTESVEFCGTLCHKVMEPEYVAYQNSPHARVACVDCHVGSGANWYVRSKLSGLYQVYAVTLGHYPKPIPTPITNLRPARETCETCHWPEKFYSRSIRFERHYLPDESNSEWNINLEMKTGPTHSALGFQEGIHWHINSDVKIEYKAVDDQREIIPWVRYTNTTTGESKIYKDGNNILTQAQLDSLETRVMDCMDCHNRPSHDYQTPLRFINNAITSGDIPKELPDIKYMAMEVLNQDFPTTDSALRYINSELNNYYSFMYEDIYENNREMINKAVETIQKEFSKNIFPSMRVKWNVYPNHIGHLEFEGCFRCHNDRHETPEKEVISMDCNLCHTIVMQSFGDSIQVAQPGKPLEFYHLNDNVQAWKTELCSECHRELYP